MGGKGGRERKWNKIRGAKPQTIPLNTKAPSVSVGGDGKRGRGGESEVSKQSVRPPKFRSKAYLECTIFTKSKMGAKEVADKWESVLGKLLDKLCVLNPEVCLLQPENIHGEGIAIYNCREYPKTFEFWDKCMDFEAEWGWSAPTPDGHSKKLSISCLMGTSRPDAEAFFDMDLRIDVSRVGNVNIFYKHVQNWKMLRKR